jgi:hypothetical protein
MHRSSLFAALLLFAIACSNGSSGNSDCPAGAERCACYPNDTCNAGLTCLSDRCVRPNGEGGVPGQDASPGQDGALPDGSTPADASCGDTSSDPNNCGRCGRVCASGTCSNGRCAPSLLGCFRESDGFATCDAFCQSRGTTCVNRGCDGVYTWVSWGIGGNRDCEGGGSPPRNRGVEPCDRTLEWGTDSTFWRRCCCVE